MCVLLCVVLALVLTLCHCLCVGGLQVYVTRGAKATLNAPLADGGYRLRHGIRTGRPDWASIFNTLKRQFRPGSVVSLTLVLLVLSFAFSSSKAPRNAV